MNLSTLNYGNYGIFLIMGNAGFGPSTVPLVGHVKLVPYRRRHLPTVFVQSLTSHKLGFSIVSVAGDCKAVMAATGIPALQMHPEP